MPLHLDLCLSPDEVIEGTRDAAVHVSGHGPLLTFCAVIGMPQEVLEPPHVHSPGVECRSI